MISKFVELQNIDVLFIASNELSNLVLDIEFDMGLEIDKSNSDAGKLFLAIKEYFE